MAYKAMAMAAGAAVLGAGALHVYLARFEEEALGGAPRSVVMVTHDLALGEVVTESALSTREIPERYIEERHIPAEDQHRVLGTRVTTQVHGGSTLLWSDLDLMQDGTTLSSLIRAGMRAFTLPERDVSFDGLLRPGDRVDVLFADGEGDPAKGSRTLLQNALVLMVGGDLGHEANKANDGSKRRDSGRVTLSVSVEDAALLTRHEGRGRIRLALRNPEDLLIVKDNAQLTAAASEAGDAR